MASQAQVLIPTTMKLRRLPAPLDNPINKFIPTKPVIVDEENSYPCRRCLRDGRLGDKMLLLSYDPFLGDSPYRQPGPIFIHKTLECDLAEFNETPAVLPEQQRRRLLSIRAFDSDHMMVGADVTEGTKLVQSAERFFSNDSVDYIHVHNAKPGCFAVRIDRGKQA